MNRTDHADRALLYALALADGLKAEISILHCAEAGADKGSSFRPLAEHLTSLLGRKRFDALGRVLSAGDPAEAALRAATREGLDLIVLAAHSKPFWESLILGTTAERILRHSLVPVLSLPSIAVATPVVQAVSNGHAKAASVPVAPWEEFL
jgi:nucleotide-binding universal stress UspA family protein